MLVLQGHCPLIGYCFQVFSVYNNLVTSKISYIIKLVSENAKTSCWNWNRESRRGGEPVGHGGGGGSGALPVGPLVVGHGRPDAPVPPLQQRERRPDRDPLRRRWAGSADNSAVSICKLTHSIVSSLDLYENQRLRNFV